MIKSLSCVKFFFCFFFAISSFFIQQSFAQSAVGQMVWVKGTVQALDTRNQARVLQRRSPIYEQDTIVTGSGSGQIVFTDNSMVALREGTTFRVEQYKFNPGSGDNRYVAGLAKGGFRTITGLISKSNPDGYQVNTPVATIGVRGTDYTVSYSVSRGLSVRLDKGALFVTNRAGTAELNAARGRVYAEIAGLNIKPVVKTGKDQTEGGAASKKGSSKTVSGICVE